MEEELIAEMVDIERPSILEYLLPQLPPMILSVLTILLIAVLLSGWKAPRWVKPIGSIAVAFAFLSHAWMFLSYCTDFTKAYEVSPTVYFPRLQMDNVILLYGLTIFLLSRIIVLIQKSRI
jgi:hypothetical protein